MLIDSRLIQAFFLIGILGGSEQDSKVHPCWDKRENSASPDVVPAPHTTVVTCMRYCLSLQGCSAIAWDDRQSPSCSVQATPVQNVRVEKKDGSAVYLLDRNCLEPHPTPYGPEICWWKLTATFYKSLTKTKATSLRECLNSCAFSDGCQVINFDLLSNEPCSIQSVKSAIDKGNFTAKDSSLCFVLNRECLEYFPSVQIENKDFCWRPLEGISDALQKVEKATRGACMDYCQETDGCAAVKFDKSCFVARSKNAPKVSYGLDELTATIGLDRSCL